MPSRVLVCVQLVDLRPEQWARYGHAFLHECVCEEGVAYGYEWGPCERRPAAVVLRTLRSGDLVRRQVCEQHVQLADRPWDMAFARLEGRTSHG